MIMTMNNTVSRKKFLDRGIRYILFLALALVAVILGTRTSSASDCNSCPGSGICSGETDCTKFLSGNYEEKGRE